MTKSVGKALRLVYEDAIEILSGQKDETQGSATRKFIDAFEADLKDTNLDLYSGPTSESRKSSKANIRSVK